MTGANVGITVNNGSADTARVTAAGLCGLDHLRVGDATGGTRELTVAVNGNLTNSGTTSLTGALTNTATTSLTVIPASQMRTSRLLTTTAVLPLRFC